ncbi:MAG: transposase [Bacteroidales bacterium]|nr:transposase [Bacteroidales bacterium]
MKFNPEIHHRRSIRIQGYDYSKPGLYFITICTHDHKYHFGKIRNGLVCLSEVGAVAWYCWRTIPDHYPQIHLHQFIVMPNHVHGIIEIVGRHCDGIADDLSIRVRGSVGVQNFEPLRMDPLMNPRMDPLMNPRLDPTFIAHENHLPVNNDCDRPSAWRTHQYQKTIPGSVGAIIRGYKSGVTKWFRKNTCHKTIWQRNFYERIIRDYTAYNNVSNYIINNPSRWEADRFYRFR